MYFDPDRMVSVYENDLDICVATDETAQAWWERESILIEKRLWPSRNGDLEIRDMETRHIFNCIDMLNRKIDENGTDVARSLVYLRLFRAELKRRKIFCKEYLQAIEARKGR